MEKVILEYRDVNDLKDYLKKRKEQLHLLPFEKFNLEAVL